MNHERAEGFWRIRWLDGPRRGEHEVAEVARPKPGSRPEDEWVRTIDGFTSLRHLWIEWGEYLGPRTDRPAMSGVHRVTRCGANCPFYEDEWSVCTKAKSDTWPSHRSVPHPENMGPPPEWCPLRAGGVLVVLNAKATP